MKLLLLLIFFIPGFQLFGQYKDSSKVFRKLTKSYEKNSDYVFVPSGSYVRGSNDSDIPTPGFNGYYLRNRVVNVDSFFMSKFEVTNAKYLEFVEAMLQKDSITGKKMLPDTMVWRSRLAEYEQYVDYYFRHPVYANYPVVGVSYEQAVAFADWCTGKYNTQNDRTFKEVRFRLPTEEEWELASKGNKEYGYLPWGDNSTLNESGQRRANFYMVSQLDIYRDSVLTPRMYGDTVKTEILIAGNRRYRIDDYDITCPVDAFEPNSLGLYNMAGNVEEMVDAYYYRDSSAYDWLNRSHMIKHEFPWGVTKGGSWMDTGYYMMYPVRQFYEEKSNSSNQIGFRLAMDVLAY